MKPGSGGGLQWVNVPKQDDDGNATQDEDGKKEVKKSYWK
jgi:hypothetical protein